MTGDPETAGGAGGSQDVLIGVLLDRRASVADEQGARRHFTRSSCRAVQPSAPILRTINGGLIQETRRCDDATLLASLAQHLDRATARRGTRVAVTFVDIIDGQAK